MKKENVINENGRRTFIKQAAVGVASGFALQGGIFSGAEQSQVAQRVAFDFAALPVLANAGEDRMEIIVAPNDFAAGWVEYGEGSSLNMKGKVSEHGLYPTSDRVLRFQLSNLKPGT